MDFSATLVVQKDVSPSCPLDVTVMKMTSLCSDKNISSTT